MTHNPLTVFFGQGPRNRGSWGSKSIPLTERALEILDGLMLGDGSISRDGFFPPQVGVSSLHQSLVLWLARLLEDEKISGRAETYLRKTLDPRGRPRKRHWRYRSFRSPEISSQRVRWYPLGKKIVPEDVRITALSLLIWYLGDGTLKFVTSGRRDHSTRFIKLYTDGFTPNEVEFLCKRLIDFGTSAQDHYGRTTLPKMSITKGKEGLSIYPEIYIGPALVKTFFGVMASLPQELETDWSYKWRDHRERR